MISLDAISVSFAGVNLFSDVSFQVNDRDRIGLVGRNGSGKSTLFRVLMGTQPINEGEITIGNNDRIGLLPQHFTQTDTEHITVLDETLSAFAILQTLEKEIAKLEHQLQTHKELSISKLEKLSHALAEKTERYHLLGGGEQEALAERMLLGLGFQRDTLHQDVSTLSGGWRMRVELAKLLLQQPTLLLLDEPTNHLDIESITWLEEYLQHYAGAVIVVSHDRRFLDTVTQRTVELTLGHAVVYNVPYTQYKTQREQQREQQLAAFRNQQQMIKETEAFIERFRYQATKSNQVQSRIKHLNRLQRIEVEEEEQNTMKIRFSPAVRSGDVVLRVRDVGKHFNSRWIFQGARLDIQRGEKIAFVGRNGEGKSTLVKIIVGKLSCNEGTVEIGHKVSIGYFAQDQSHILDDTLTVYETIDQEATGDDRMKIRDMLAAFLFRGEEIDKRVGVLSGGERNRLALLKLMLHPCNFLVLDEPTNHLDMASKDVLKDALLHYEGTVLIVSHDRDFLSGLVDKVYEFTQQRVREHMGGIEDFLATRNLENLQELNKQTLHTPSSDTPIADTKTLSNEDNNAQLLWKQQKQHSNAIKRKRNTLTKLEAKIAAHEQELKRLSNCLSKGDTEENLKILPMYQKEQEAHDYTMQLWEDAYTELELLMHEGATES